jgi:pre-rRNA-processing protein TSR3
MSQPITLIVRDPKENPKKCSILPLRGRADIQIFTYPPEDLPPLDDYLRLAGDVDCPVLSTADRERGILVLDGSWRSVGKMSAHFAHVSPRRLSGWKTAYPRVSKLGSDPAEGLASLEALYLAYHILGRPTDGLLDHYRWAAHFIELNALPG